MESKIKATNLNVTINPVRTFCGITGIIAGITTYFINKAKDNNKYIACGALLSFISGLVLIFIEIEKSFKPIDIEDKKEDYTNE